jgi:uncharacterized protein (DUF169 family)
MSQFRVISERMKTILGLDSEPVGVFLLSGAEHLPPFRGFQRVEGHRYCQALMRARRGECILLDAEGLVCPAAAAAFGFRPLPEPLASGKGLVGFGIVSNALTGQRMFADMPRLDAGSIVGLALAPLHLAPRPPDVVVVEGAAESLMWLLLADLNLNGGERRRASTAVLQATCVDATVIPFCERRLNFSLGCYGCREATDMAPGETVLGFPGAMLDGLMERLEELSQKAIPRSRAKQAYRHLQGANVHAVTCDTEAGAPESSSANLKHDY